jgi:hypothetical protein
MTSVTEMYFLRHNWINTSLTIIALLFTKLVQAFHNFAPAKLLITGDLFLEKNYQKSIKNQKDYVEANQTSIRSRSRIGIVGKLPDGKQGRERRRSQRS